MQHRGAIVYHDLLRSSTLTSRFWFLASFLAGIVVLLAFLEVCTSMSDDDNRVLDPPLQHNDSSDDDIHGGPPTPWTGVALNLLINLTLKQMVAQIFHLNVDTPGLIRVLCNSTPIDFRTTIAGLDWPRRVYVQVSSFTEYQRAVHLFNQLQHAPVAPPQEHRARGTLPVQVYLHFVSVFRALQQYENLISSQSVVIGPLEDRLTRLERSVSTGEPLVLTPRQVPELSVWFPESPPAQSSTAASDHHA